MEQVGTLDLLGTGKKRSAGPLPGARDPRDLGGLLEVRVGGKAQPLVDC